MTQRSFRVLLGLYSDDVLVLLNPGRSVACGSGPTLYSHSEPASTDSRFLRTSFDRKLDPLSRDRLGLVLPMTNLSLRANGVVAQAYSRMFLTSAEYE